MSALDLLLHQVTSCGLIASQAEVPHVDVVLYDQQTMEPLVMMEKTRSCPRMTTTVPSAPTRVPSTPVVCQQPLKPRSCGKKPRTIGGAAQMDDSTFLSVLMEKLSSGAEFSSVKILKGN